MPLPLALGLRTGVKRPAGGCARIGEGLGAWGEKWPVDGACGIIGDLRMMFACCGCCAKYAAEHVGLCMPLKDGGGGGCGIGNPGAPPLAVPPTPRTPLSEPYDCIGNDVYRFPPAPDGDDRD
jgi:hypothetical protein